MDEHCYYSENKDADDVDIGLPCELKVREESTSKSLRETLSNTSMIDGKRPAKNPIPLTAKYDPVKAVPATRIGVLSQ